MHAGAGITVALVLRRAAEGTTRRVVCVVRSSGGAAIDACSTSKSASTGRVEAFAGVVGQERGDREASLLGCGSCDRPAARCIGGVVIGEVKVGGVDDASNETTAHIDVRTRLLSSHVDGGVGV